MKLLRRTSPSGSSLLEIIIAVAVIAILATLVTPIFQAWISNTASKTCQRNIALVQENMRSYAGLNNLAIGATLASASFIGTTNSSLMAPPTCGESGNYTYGSTVPAVGVVYATCSKTTPVNHNPASTAGW